MAKMNVATFLMGNISGKLPNELGEHERGIIINQMIESWGPPDPSDYGRLVVKGGQLEAIIEAKEASPTVRKIRLCNSGVMGLKAPEIWPLLKRIKANNTKKEYYLTDIVSIARCSMAPAR